MSANRPPSRRGSGALATLAQAVVHGMFALSLVLGTLAARERGLFDRWLGPGPTARAATEAEPEAPVQADNPQWVRSAARLLAPAAPSRVVYLNREGAELRGGPDDATLNVSSVVAASPTQRAQIPAFAGTPSRWKQLVKCVRDKFAPFDVRVVEQRPLGEEYLMVMVGGEAKDLGFHASDGHKHSHAAGLAPFNGQNIPNAVVFVFSRTLREQLKPSCDAAGMEIAHAYGLDHARHCKDLMTYMPSCGTRSFLDKDLPCGEHKDRPCEGGAPTQNSYRQLMSLLGPAKPAAN